MTEIGLCRTCLHFERIPGEPLRGRTPAGFAGACRLIEIQDGQLLVQEDFGCVDHEPGRAYGKDDLVAIQSKRITEIEVEVAELTESIRTLSHQLERRANGMDPAGGEGGREMNQVRAGDVASIRRIESGWVVVTEEGWSKVERHYAEWDDVLTAVSRHAIFHPVGVPVCAKMFVGEAATRAATKEEE